MKATFNFNFYCRKSKVRRDGQAAIELSVIINGQRTYISLPKRMNPEDFEKDLTSRRNNETKRFIANYTAKVNTTVSDMLENGIALTADNLKDCLLFGVVKSFKLSNLIEEFFSILRGRMLCAQTYRRYEISFGLFVKTVGDKDVTDVKNSDILKYLNVVERSVQDSTGYGYFARVKSLFTFALNNGYVKNNPCAGIKVKKNEKEIVTITEDEYVAIRDHCFNDRVSRVRDLFVLACCSGMAFSDLLSCKKEEFRNEGGRWYISGERIKTKSEFTSVILDDGVKILESIDFDVSRLKISNCKFNSYLKEIGDIVGVECVLTAHKARHYYITHLMRCGVPLESVMRAVGHKTSQMTRRYTHLLERDIVKSVNKFI